MHESVDMPPRASEEEADDRAERLDALGLVLASSRAEVIAARHNSGIEDEWLEDEEHYEGIDDANRGEHHAAWRTKPPGRTYVSADEDEEGSGSTIFLNITQPYCDAAAARIGDMLLPTDEPGWAISETPIPQLAGVAEGEFGTDLEQQILQQAGSEGAAAAIKQELQAKAKADIEQAQEAAKRAGKRIEDWHVECQYHAEVRAVLEDCARIGTGILKGPFPAKRRKLAYIDGELVIREQIQPVSKRIDPWNFFPDGGCGRNIHDGSVVWERDDITRKKLEALKGAPGYIDEQIDLVLSEGPFSATREAPQRVDARDGLTPAEGGKNLFEIWYFHGQVERDDLEACGCEIDDEDATRSVHAQVTMVNNRVIRAILNPLDDGSFPYDLMPYKRRAGMPWGTGVARAIRAPQRVVNAAARNMMDNAGVAGGANLIIHQGMIVPENGRWEWANRKVWIVGEDATVDLEHFDKAFRFVAPPMYQAELQAIVMLGMKWAEDVTGMPMIMQGQMGQKAPDTLGGMQMLHNNSSTVLRRIARLFDDHLTEPHIRRYYVYLLQYGEDAEKGDFSIDARGSSSLVERALQSEAVLPLLQASANPAYGIDPKKTMQEYLRSQRLDPQNFEFDDEQWQQVVQKLAEQPQDTSVQVAEIRAAAAEAVARIRQETDHAKMRGEWEQNGRDRALKAAEMELTAQLEKMEFDGDQEKTRATLKKGLADTVLKLSTQRELAGMKQVTEPPTEPPGRAPDGEAYAA